MVFTFLYCQCTVKKWPLWYLAENISRLSTETAKAYQELKGTSAQEMENNPGRISQMKHDLQGPLCILLISVPSTYFSFTVFLFLIQSRQAKVKMEVQNIINQGNVTGQTKNTYAIEAGIKFGLNFTKVATAFPSLKKAARQKHWPTFGSISKK